MPPCGQTPRVTRIAVGLFARDITIADDGTRTVDSLGATVMYAAPAVATCSDAVAFFGAELVPQT